MVGAMGAPMLVGVRVGNVVLRSQFARLAPGSSSFSSCAAVLFPAHVAPGGVSMLVRLRPSSGVSMLVRFRSSFSGVGSVARPCSFGGVH